MSHDEFARVRAIGCALPNVATSTRYDGMPVLKLHGVFLAAMAAPQVAPGTLIARVDPDDRDLLLDEAPDVYYLTESHRPHPVVLVRLSAIDDDALRDLLRMSWRVTARKARR
jgi:hypothetical protein